MDQNTGRYIVFAGIGIVIVGLVIWFFRDKLNWIGRLPGDIRIEKENFRFYFPLTTMILFSILLTIMINVIRKLF
jgi:H+/Cl- antiporter ClcA